MKVRPVEPEFHAGSGNVFHDLNVPEPDRELVKAGLVRAICSIVSGRKLKQADVATELKIAQPKVSLLLRGRTAGFSSDALMRFLNRLGQSIAITVTPSAPGARTGGIRVYYEALPRAAKPQLAHGAPITERHARVVVANSSRGGRQVARARTTKKR
jgi:predicted XRE-type DNA-binding protein